MSYDESTYDLIQKHLDGELTAEEQAQFDKLSEQDSEFQKLVESMKLANEVIIETELLDIKEKISNYDFKKTQGGNKGSNKWFFVIIILAVVCSSIPFFIKDDQSQQPVSGQDDLTMVDNKLQESSTIETGGNQNQPGSKEEKVVTTEFQTAIQIDNNPDDIITVDSTQTLIDSTEADPDVVTKPVDDGQQITQIDTDTSGAEEPSTEITFDLSTEPACEGKSDGKIVVSNVEPNIPPHIYIVNGEEVDESGLESQQAGIYTVELEDAAGNSSSMKSATIASKECKNIDQFEAAIAPDFGGDWEVPMKDGLAAEVFVYNQHMQIVWQKNLNSGEFFSWDGTISSGVLPASDYPVKIFYSDGSMTIGVISIIK